MNGDTFKVYSEQCNECLFSPNRIVSSARMKAIIKQCLRTDTYFVCHKATMAGQDVCCRGFYDTYKNDITITRAARMFHAVEEVAIPESSVCDEGRETV